LDQVSIRITDRDRKIFAAIAENRFLTAKEIGERFWPTTKSKHHHERLRLFTRLRYLEHLLGDNSTRLGFRLADKGIAELHSEELKSKALANRSFSYKSTFDHDKLLTRIRAIFETSPLVSNYLSEHEVRSLLAVRYGREEEKGEKGYKVPDALFSLRTPRGTRTVALELELSTKSVERYRKIFRELLTSSDFDVVFFITKSDDMTSNLSRLLDEVRENDMAVRSALRKHRFYFVSLEEFLNKRLEACFEGTERVFSLSALKEKADTTPTPRIRVT